MLGFARLPFIMVFEGRFFNPLSWSLKGGFSSLYHGLCREVFQPFIMVFAGRALKKVHVCDSPLLYHDLHDQVEKHHHRHTIITLIIIIIIAFLLYHHQRGLW